MYYSEMEANQSFARAAETMARVMEGSEEFGAADVVTIRWFDTEANFVGQWSSIYEHARTQKMLVGGGAVLSHAGTSVDAKGGGLGFFAPRRGEGRIYVLPDPRNVIDPRALQSIDRRSDGTFDAKEIAKLPRLPWAPGAKLELRGCRTGLGDVSAAQLFRDSQQTIVEGQTGWADFSSRPDEWVPIDASSRDVHLHAYERGWNSRRMGRNAMFEPLGDGRPSPIVIESPNASVGND